MESYIEDKKNLYTSIHEFLEEFDDSTGDEVRKDTFEKLIEVIRSQQIVRDAKEMRQFLEIIKSIGEHHHRDQYFNERINQLLLHIKDQIKQTLPDLEIFHLFENNKKIVHFLIKKGIITISDDIHNEMIYKLENNGNRYCHFFIPELENFLGDEKIQFFKNEILKEDPTFFNNYEEKREEGENDSYICSLIRQDSVEEFIKHVNRHNISPSSKILASIFETNPFLIDNKSTSLIEYSAFFGSIQIFHYLLMNKAELTPSLWLYGVHSQNAEIINLLESNEVPPPDNYEQWLIESIKCHHNDIADYIENNYIDRTEQDSQQIEEIISNCIKYHNYKYFQNDIIIEHGFFHLNFYHYDKLFELLVKKKEESISNKIIQYPNIRTALANNEIEVIYHHLLKMQEISKGLFKYIRIKQITIPSSITSIGESALFNCSSLAQITIPSSVTSIGKNAFKGCTSLIEISISSSITSIEDYAFSECTSLTQISIPSSVTSIKENAFSGCSSLTHISIPSSVTSIDEYAFCYCSSLAQILIPSSVRSIGINAFHKCLSLNKFIIIPCKKELVVCYDNQFLLCKSNPNSDVYDTFLWVKQTINEVIIPTYITNIADGSLYECSSLTQITIPSSVISIGKYAFSGCSSLTQIVFEIPSSVTSIGDSSFSGCSSLTQIAIPSSVTSIKQYAFSGCSSLTQITIPSSMNSIERSSFSVCSSLTQITFEIPSSVTLIGEYAFYRCSSLTQIALPSSVTSIGKYAFSGCSSLTQFTIPSSVTSIGDSAFEVCTSLTQITFEIPSSVTSIGNSAFKKCSSLTQITIPSSVTSIGNDAFSGCPLLA